MTPEHQQPKEHCDHECVCGVLMVGGTEGDRSPCDFSGCQHDTRSRPHPAPAQRDDNWHYTPDEMKQHDAAISRKAREDECERIYGLFHEVERLHLNGMAYPDLYNEMVARIKFIHTEPLSKDGRKKESLRSTQQQAGEP